VYHVRTRTHARSGGIGIDRYTILVSDDEKRCASVAPCIPTRDDDRRETPRSVPFRTARRGTGEDGTVAGTASGNLQPQTMHILLAENRAGWVGLAP